MKVHDLVVYWDNQFRHHRIWEVKSICLGMVGQESLVELKSLTEKPGVCTENRTHYTTWVPEPILRQFPVFSQTAVPVPTSHFEYANVGSATEARCAGSPREALRTSVRDSSI